MPRSVVPIVTPFCGASIARSSAMCQGNTTCARSLISSRPASGTPRSARVSSSRNSVSGLSTTPGAMTLTTWGQRIPLGTWCSL